MTQETKHTPTPWLFNDCSPEANGGDPSYEILDSKGISFVSDEDYYNCAPDKQTAAFIVRACNAHDELVSCAEAFYKMQLFEIHQAANRGEKLREHILRGAIHKTAQAIAKARGEA